MYSSYTLWFLISHLLTSIGAEREKTANVWEFKVGNNANIVDLVRLWKTRMNDSNWWVSPTSSH